MCFVCDLLCNDGLCVVVGFVCVVNFICVGLLIICLLDVFMMHCVLVSGLCLCGFVVMRVGFDVLVRVGCDLLCDVV